MAKCKCMYCQEGIPDGGMLCDGCREYMACVLATASNFYVELARVAREALVDFERANSYNCWCQD